MVTVYPQNINKEPIELYKSIPENALKQALLEVARAEGVEIEVESSQFKVGDGIISALSSTPCIVIYNSKHKKKYHSLVLEQKQTYNRNYLYVHFGGRSQNQTNINMGKSYYTIVNNDISIHRPGIIGKLSSNKAHQKMRDEELYYDIAFRIIGAAIAKAESIADNPIHQNTTPKTSTTPPKATNRPSVTVSSKPHHINANTEIKQHTKSSKNIQTDSNTDKPYFNHKNFYAHYINYDALKEHHPQIYKTLMTNPIYLSTKGPTKTNIHGIQGGIIEYTAPQKITAIKCNSDPNFTELFIKDIKIPHPVKKGTSLIYFCSSDFFDTTDRGYAVTPDYFVNKEGRYIVTAIPLEDIQTISINNKGIHINNQHISNSVINAEQQYNVLVYPSALL